MEKIEFYKNRSLGERFSAAAEFIRQNWKVLCKIILIPAIPLALLQGYFQQNFIGEYISLVRSTVQGESIFDPQNLYGFYTSVGMYFLVYLVYTTILYAVSGALMSRYEAGLLSRDTTLKDISRKTISNIGKLLLIGFLMGLMLLVLYIVLIVLVVMFANVPALIFIAVILFFIACAAIMPPMLLTYFPAFFRGASAAKSIKEAFILGFKNWGSTVVVMLIVSFAIGMVSSILQIPYIIWLVLDNVFLYNDPANIVSYVLSIVSSLAYAFVTPLTLVFFAFHYFSIAEKEEGISIQSKIEEFDNL